MIDSRTLKMVVDFINDMLDSNITDVVAVPGEGAVAWERVFQGKGQYRITRNEAFAKQKKAGYNPQALLDAALKKYGAV